MRNRITWIVSCLLFIIHSCVQYFVYSLPTFLGQTFHKFLVSINLLLPFVVAVILAIIISFIPNKKKSYDDKFSLNLPIILSGTLLLSSGFYSYTIYAFKEKHSGPLYESIKVNPKLDCESVKNGKFKTEDSLLVEREGDFQVQTRRNSKTPDEFKVVWVNNCEYILTPVSNPALKLKVKIISVDKDGYTCYVAIDSGGTSQYTLKRVK